MAGRKKATAKDVTRDTPVLVQFKLEHFFQAGVSIIESTRHRTKLKKKSSHHLAA